jgi:hypothetical protein
MAWARCEGDNPDNLDPAYNRRLEEITDRIAALPGRTSAGLQVKAKAAHRQYCGRADDCRDDIGKQLERQIIDFLLRTEL